MHTPLSITPYTVDTARTHRRKTHPHRDHKVIFPGKSGRVDYAAWAWFKKYLCSNWLGLR